MISSEKSWLKELEKGEDKAFRVLFEHFYAPLAGFACKYIEEQGQAEDIVQDVLYELWLKKLPFNDLPALKAYLFTTVRNRCLDVIKHRKVEKKYLREQHYKEHTEFFLQSLLEEEIFLALKEAVGALPQQTGKVFELALDGLDNAQIAKLLHLSIDAVKAHKKRGKKILQEKLKGLIFLYIIFRL